MGLKVHEVGVKLANSLVVECGSFCEIEANIVLMFQWKERLEITFSKNNWNISLLEPYRGLSNTKCARVSTRLWGAKVA
jgi:hypothetical protein